MNRVGVTGASGFIGTALVGALIKRGDAVLAFTRRPQSAQIPTGADVRQLDLMSSASATENIKAFEGLDAVVHLAGEPLTGRWTSEKKRKIHDSRQISTRNLVAAMRACGKPPLALVCASGAGYYGSRGDEPLTESSPRGHDYLSQVCVDWELEAATAAEFGVRVVLMRQGPLMGRGGGALQAMLPPFRFGAGGPLGSGAQWWPWIHLDDAIAMYLFAIDREDLNGPLNVASPDLATNARFSQALGYALRRPSLAFAPGPALKILLGEFAESLLGSQLMLPAKAQDLGFAWRHESLDQALLDLLDPGTNRVPGTTRFEAAETIPADPDRVFDFLSNAANLKALTPPSLRFNMLTPSPIEMRRGTIVEYEVKVRGLPLRWKTLITKWQPGVRFADLQIRGPYLLWRHQHDFETKRDGVAVRDTIDYALPFAPLSNIALPLVRSDVRRIFDYRRAALLAIDLKVR